LPNKISLQKFLDFEKYFVLVIRLAKQQHLSEVAQSLVKLKLSIRGKYLNFLKRVKGITPTLTIKGFIFHCANKINNSTEEKFDWGNALIDAAITSAITFFSALGGGAVAGLNSINIIVSAAVAAFSQFFIFLALKRGLVQPKEAQAR
jgi:hypothetical protein